MIVGMGIGSRVQNARIGVTVTSDELKRDYVVASFFQSDQLVGKRLYSLDGKRIQDMGEVTEITPTLKFVLDGGPGGIWGWAIPHYYTKRRSETSSPVVRSQRESGVPLQ